MHDPLMLGFLAGLVAAATKGVVNYGAFLLGLTNLSVLHLSQRLIFHVPQPLTGPVLALSFTAFVVFGGLFGVILAYIYVLTGTDYGYIKGAGFGWLAYYVLETFLVPLVQPNLDMPYTSAAVAINLSTHLLYGLVAALVILKWGHLQAGRRDVT